MSRQVRNGESERASVVRNFYEALSTGDADAVRALVRERFADDATLTWPDSLPYGGTVAGKARLERVLGRAAGSAERVLGTAAGSAELVGVQKLRLVDLIDGGDRVAAQLEFDWYAPNGAGSLPGTGAIEVWTFTGDFVHEIKAYYWDTAACAALPGSS